MTYNQGVKLFKRWLVPIALVAIVLIGSWSLFRPGMFRVHDFTQTGRVAEMARALQDGQLPVRWSQNFGYGYGMPLFTFYAPLPYYIGALFWLVGVPLMLILKFLLIFPTILAVCTLYLLARRWLPASGALLAAAALSAAPYRAVNLFIRGAVSEMWGMAFFVLALWGLVLTYDKKRWGWLILSGAITGIVISHNLTMVLSVIPLGGMIILLILEDLIQKKQSLAAWWQNRKGSLSRIVGSGLLAVGLSAFYWLPAVTMQHSTQLDTYILSDYFDFRKHFLYIRQFFADFWRFGGSTWGPDDDITFFLGWGQLLGAGITGSVGAYYLLIKRQGRWVLPLGVGVLTAICLAMTLQHALPLWEQFEFLKYIQFPWRFISVAIPLFALFSAWWTTAKLPKWLYISMYLLVAGLLIFNVRQFVPEQWIENPEVLYSVEPRHIQGPLSVTLHDYVPVGFSIPLSWEKYEGLAPGSVSCVFDECDISVVASSSAQALISVTAKAEPEALVIARSYFPGWIAEVNGARTAIKPGENASMYVQIPAGTSLVGIRFGRSPEMAIADALTVVSALIVVYFVFKAQAGHAKK